MPTPTETPAPRTLVIRAPGTNCERELVRAFELAGSVVRTVHLDALMLDPSPMAGSEIIALPGGFSYGDDIASGRVFAAKLASGLLPHLHAARDRGALIFGVCNGFQVLARLGLLPGWDDQDGQVVSLTQNASGSYRDDWVRLSRTPGVECVWTRGLPDEFECPYAHAEGRVVVKSPGVLDRLETGGLIALRYARGSNPNGSVGDIAGITDPTGRILGLMPHPERAVQPTDQRAWTRKGAETGGPLPGLRLFLNAVEEARRSVECV